MNKATPKKKSFQMKKLAIKLDQKKFSITLDQYCELVANMPLGEVMPNHVPNAAQEFFEKNPEISRLNGALYRRAQVNASKRQAVALKLIDEIENFHLQNLQRIHVSSHTVD